MGQEGAVFPRLPPSGRENATRGMEDAQREALYRNGYVVLPRVVPETMVARALWAINHDLGQHGIDPSRLAEYSARSFCPELRESKAITDLCNATPLWTFAESAIGCGMLHQPRSGQIALRFPRPGPIPVATPHLDGMYSPTNGVPKGQIQNFTALAGVFLSDLPGPDAGNFTVWPGTHRLYETYFRARGPQALLEGMPKVPLPEPVQITARAGDGILCHYQLAHAANGNASPHIRYACFFRLSRVDHATVHWECMTDIWREWDGMRDFIKDPASGSVVGPVLR